MRTDGEIESVPRTESRSTSEVDEYPASTAGPEEVGLARVQIEVANCHLQRLLRVMLRRWKRRSMALVEDTSLRCEIVLLIQLLSSVRMLFQPPAYATSTRGACLSSVANRRRRA